MNQISFQTGQGQGQGQPQQNIANDPFQFAFNPEFASSMDQVQQVVKNPFLQQIGMNLGSRVFNMSKKYDGFIHQIFSSDYRYYFDVDNGYVLKKVGILLAPFLQRGEWSGRQASSPTIEQQHFFQEEDINASFKHMGFSSPKSNLHAPDLYIPIMSFFTFILICCFSMGIDKDISLKTNTFHPNKVGDTFWKCLVVSLLEVIICKIVFCFLEARVGTIDLISHLNYRYVTQNTKIDNNYSLCFVICFNILIGGTFTMFLTWYLLFCQAFFVFKTIQRYSHNARSNQLGFKSNLILYFRVELVWVINYQCVGNFATFFFLGVTQNYR